MPTDTTRAASREPIDDAWSEANGVLPGVFWVVSVTHIDRMTPPHNFTAKALNDGPLSVDKYGGSQSAYGDSPTDALRNLTARLRWLRDGGTEPKRGKS